MIDPAPIVSTTGAIHDGRRCATCEKAPESSMSTVASRLEETAGKGSLPKSATGDTQLRIFAIRNMGYKLGIFVAEDQAGALNLAATRGHMRRASLYRKFEDQTEALLAEHPELQAILDTKTQGVLVQEGGDWKLT